MAAPARYGVLIDDKYLLIDKIAESRYAEVFLVCDPTTGELFTRKLNLYDDAQSVQETCQEIRLTPNRPHTTRIRHTQFYPTSHTLSSNEGAQRGYQSIVTEFCDGGTLEDLQYSLIFSGRRLPEAMVWRFFGQAFETLFTLATTSPFITQGDCTAQNWFFHWAPHQEPTLVLGDFGDACEHLSLSNVFQVHINVGGPMSGSWGPRPTQSEVQDLEEWWERVCHDMRCGLQQITALITHNLNHARWMVWSDLYADAVHKRSGSSKGFRDYSLNLAMALFDWYEHITAQPQLGVDYSQWVAGKVVALGLLRDHVAMQSHLASMAERHLLAGTALNWMRPVLQNDTPISGGKEDLVAWKTRSSNFQGDVNAGTLMLDSNTDHRIFTLPIQLREGQYEIVKITQRKGRKFDWQRLRKLRNRHVL